MLINKKAVKAYALGVSESKRAGKFKRVSAQFLDRVEFIVRETVRKEIERHPSLGVTLK